MAEQSYHLYRKYIKAPAYRWACEVVPDAKVTDGYRVVKSDPIVADTWFLHRLHEGLTREAQVPFSEATSEATMSGHEPIVPGDPGYLDRAIRVIPDCIYGSAPTRRRA